MLIRLKARILSSEWQQYYRSIPCSTPRDRRYQSNDWDPRPCHQDCHYACFPEALHKLLSWSSFSASADWPLREQIYICGRIVVFGLGNPDGIFTNWGVPGWILDDQIAGKAALWTGVSEKGVRDQFERSSFLVISSKLYLFLYHAVIDAGIGNVEQTYVKQSWSVISPPRALLKRYKYQRCIFLIPRQAGLLSFSLMSTSSSAERMSILSSTRLHVMYIALAELMFSIMFMALGIVLLFTLGKFRLIRSGRWSFIFFPFIQGTSF